jgi:acylphosphatase
VTELPELERREVIFRGRVQGVGFRYTTRQIAARFRVVGFVRNQPDGTVQLVVEGEPAELDRFIQAVAGEFDGYITDQTSRVAPTTGEFSHFSVRH